MLVLVLVLALVGVLLHAAAAIAELTVVPLIFCFEIINCSHNNIS
jgi:hypothetical protein